MSIAPLQVSLIVMEAQAAPFQALKAEGYSGAAVIVQQPAETTENLLQRVTRRTQKLRESGRLLREAFFLLRSSDRQLEEERLMIGRTLLEVLSCSPSVLHLVAPRGEREQDHGLFELAGQLLSEQSRHSIRLELPEKLSSRLSTAPETDLELPWPEPSRASSVSCPSIF